MSEQSDIKILVDQRFAIDASKQYELGIVISKNRCVALLFSVDENRFDCLIEKELSDFLTKQEFEAEVSLFLDNRLFSAQFKRVSVVYLSPKATLVPEALFDKNQVQAFFTCNHIADADDEIEYCKIRSVGICSVFAFPKFLKNLVNTKFSTPQLLNQSVVLIDSLLLANKHKAVRKKVYVNVAPTFFDVIVLLGDSLLLYNSFTYTNSKDFIYFLLLIYEQLKLNPEIHETTFMGNISYDSDCLMQAKRFIKNINFVSFKDEAQRFSYVLNHEQLYKYVSVINSFKCA